jgi:hypothetical protein
MRSFLDCRKQSFIRLKGLSRVQPCLEPVQRGAFSLHCRHFQRSPADCFLPSLVERVVINVLRDVAHLLEIRRSPVELRERGVTASWGISDTSRVARHNLVSATIKKSKSARLRRTNLASPEGRLDAYPSKTVQHCHWISISR